MAQLLPDMLCLELFFRDSRLHALLSRWYSLVVHMLLYKLRTRRTVQTLKILSMQGGMNNCCPAVSQTSFRCKRVG